MVRRFVSSRTSRKRKAAPVINISDDTTSNSPTIYKNKKLKTSISTSSIIIISGALSTITIGSAPPTINLDKD